MKLNGKEVLACNCEGTMTIDGKALAKACQGGELDVASHLCRTQIEEFQRFAGQGHEGKGPGALRGRRRRRRMTKVNFPRIFMGDNGESGSYITSIGTKTRGEDGR